MVIIDTAGRLQNKTQLMAELAKIRDVIERRMPGQPRHVLLVLDATTGQNGLSQAEAFSREAGVTGIVLTKLDGTSKGGMAVAAADGIGVPIVFAGVGEEIDALAPVRPRGLRGVAARRLTMRSGRSLPPRRGPPRMGSRFPGLAGPAGALRSLPHRSI